MIGFDLAPDIIDTMVELMDMTAKDGNERGFVFCDSTEGEPSSNGPRKVTKGTMCTGEGCSVVTKDCVGKPEIGAFHTHPHSDPFSFADYMTGWNIANDNPTKESLICMAEKNRGIVCKSLKKFVPELGQFVKLIPKYTLDGDSHGRRIVEPYWSEETYLAIPADVRIHGFSGHSDENKEMMLSIYNNVQEEVRELVRSGLDFETIFFKIKSRSAHVPSNLSYTIKIAIDDELGKAPGSLADFQKASTDRTAIKKPIAPGEPLEKRILDFLNRISGATVEEIAEFTQQYEYYISTALQKLLGEDKVKKSDDGWWTTQYTAAWKKKRGEPDMSSWASFMEMQRKEEVERP